MRRARPRRCTRPTCARRCWPCSGRQAEKKNIDLRGVRDPGLPPSGRTRQAAADPDEPAVERDQVHAGGRPGDAAVAGQADGRSWSYVIDTGVGHRAGGAGTGLREVPAGGQPDDPRAGRHRPGTVDRAGTGQAARRGRDVARASWAGGARSRCGCRPAWSRRRGRPGRGAGAGRSASTAGCRRPRPPRSRKSTSTARGFKLCSARSSAFGSGAASARRFSTQHPRADAAPHSPKNLGLTPRRFRRGHSSPASVPVPSPSVSSLTSMRSSSDSHRLLSGVSFGVADVPARLERAAAAAGQQDRQVVVVVARCRPSCRCRRRSCSGPAACRRPP